MAAAAREQIPRIRHLSGLQVPTPTSPAAAPALEGKILGGTYRLLRRLDEGGMGVVFAAEHIRTRRRVAVKTLAPAHASNPEVLARFELEAALMSRIDHPHVVELLDFDTQVRPDPYLVVELLRGETLDERLRTRAPLPVEEAVEIAAQTAAALAAAHRAGVAHCDLKPANVFLTENPGASPFVKLIDFGVGKDLRAPPVTAESIAGTPEYMAPEQAAGRHPDVDGRADQWALAVLTYEMLTGEQPFVGGDSGETLERVQVHDIPAASAVACWIPPAIDAVLERALSRSPDARYADVLEFARDLQRAAQNSLFPASSAAPSSGVRAKTMPSLAPVSKERCPTSPALPGRRSGEDGARTLPSARDGERNVVASAHAALDGAGGALRRMLGSIECARLALDRGDVGEATAHAEAAVRAADDSQDAAVAELVRLSEPLLARVFMRRVGSPSRRLVSMHDARRTDDRMSPHAAYLLSRIDRGMTVSEVIDVSSAPPLSALRGLVQLVSHGLVELD